MTTTAQAARAVAEAAENAWAEANADAQFLAESETIARLKAKAAQVKANAAESTRDQAWEAWHTQVRKDTP